MMRAFTRHTLLLQITVLLIAAMGCRTGAELSPAPSAAEVPGEDAAVSSIDGVELRAQPGMWPGDVPINREVTPIEVTIDNDSDLPVQLRYDQFALVGPQGTRYSALPPYDVEGEVDEPEMARVYSPISNPLFAHDRFVVAPYYADVYPGIGVYADPFLYDPLYHDNYFTYWEERELPTEDMLRRGLPEGVVEPGGEVTGFLFFENVDPDQPRVEFRGQIVDARTGNRFGTVTIPFTVEGD